MCPEQSNKDDETSDKVPPVPDGWTRCHQWLPRKKKFCRQIPVVAPVSEDHEKNRPQYCGNHRHLDNQQQTSRKRIRCPMDPSHWIYQDTVDKHVNVCPIIKKQKLHQEQPYYCKNINEGGQGDIGGYSTETTQAESMEWAKTVALKVLHLHQVLFVENSSQPAVNDQHIKKLVFHDIYNAIKLEDLSPHEFQAGIENAVETLRIRSGGPLHLHQQASILGHLRAIGAIPPIHQKDNSKTAESKGTGKTIILEVGAGRGMTGLVAASAAAATQPVHGSTHFVMIERGGSRGKAETVLRRAVGERTEASTRTYLDPGRLIWSRVNCDLSHVDLEAVLNPILDPSSNDDKFILVAKHLCGVGTDLALKSVQPVAHRLKACILATCCHGICNWEHYVGREFLRSAFSRIDQFFVFGGREFDLLRRWSSGSVRANVETSIGTESTKEIEGEHHTNKMDSTASGYITVRMVVDALALSCSVNGLGRACQRLIDYGRKAYIENILLQGKGTCRLVHYVSKDVTPQNAAIIAHR